MDKDELWKLLCSRYPKFKDPDYVVKQTARGLRRCLDQAWDEGRKKGRSENPRNGDAKEAGDLIDQIFQGFK